MNDQAPDSKMSGQDVFGTAVVVVRDEAVKRLTLPWYEAPTRHLRADRHHIELDQVSISCFALF